MLKDLIKRIYNMQEHINNTSKKVETLGRNKKKWQEI